MAKPTWRKQFEKSLSARYEDPDGWSRPEHFVAGEVASGAIRSVVECLVARLGGMVDADLESPIEEAMYWAMLGVSFQKNDGTFLECNGRRHGIGGSGLDSLVIEPQVKVGRFRIDFRITHTAVFGPGQNDKAVASVLIECDGHEFHERTKEQARRDRSRDRQLAADGHQTLRFTGSEIWADPFKCAGQAIDFVANRANEIAIEKIRAARSGGDGDDR